MARPSGEQLYQNLYANKVRWVDLSSSDKTAVKNYITFKNQKTFSTEQPLQATASGQAQLKKAASVPLPKPQKPEPKRELTWGEQLNEALTRQFPQAYPAAKEALGTAGKNIMANPAIGIPVGLLGAGATSLQDVIAEALDPTSRKTIGQTIGQQVQNVQQGASDFLKSRVVSEPTLGGFLGAVSPQTASGTVQAGLGKMAQQARPALDITRGIYEQSAMATRGLTPEQAKVESAAWVARNPNLAGISSNVLGATLDPLNVPIAGVASKVGRGVELLGEAVKKAPAPPQQVATTQAPLQPSNVSKPTLVDTPEGLKVTQPEPLPQPTLQQTVHTEPQVQVARPEPQPEPQVVEPVAETQLQNISDMSFEELGKEREKALIKFRKQIADKYGLDSTSKFNKQQNNNLYALIDNYDKTNPVGIAYKKIMDEKFKQMDATKLPVKKKETVVPKQIEQDLAPKPKAVDVPTTKLTAKEQKTFDEYRTRTASGKPEDQLDPDEQKEYQSLLAKSGQQAPKPVTQLKATLVKASETKPDVAEKITEDLGKKPEPKDPAKSPLVQKALQLFSKKVEEAKKRNPNMTYRDYSDIQVGVVSEFFSSAKIRKELEKKYGEDYKDSDEYADYLDQKVYFKSETDKLMPERENLAQRKERERSEAEQKQKEEKQRKDEQKARQQKEIIESLTDEDIEMLAKNVDQTADPRFVQELELRKKNKQAGKTSEKVKKMDENLSTLKQFFMGDVTNLPSEKLVETEDFKKHFESLGYSPELFEDFKEFYIKNERLKREYIDVTELGAKDKKRAKEYQQKSDELAYTFADKDEAFEAKRQGKPAPEIPFSVRMKEKEKQKQKQEQAVGQSINDTLQAENDKRDLAKKMSQGIVSVVLPSKVSKGQIKSNVESVEKLMSTTTVQGMIQSIKNKLAEFKEQFSGENFKELFRAYNGTSNDIREDLFEGERKIARSAQEAEETIKLITQPLTNERDMELFERIIVLRDAKATLDSSDIADVPMPYDLTINDIVPELKRYEEMAKNNKGVQDAIKNYESTMEQIFDDLVARKLLPESSRRKDYFPHRVAEYASKIKYGGGAPLDTPYRGYTKARKGTKKAYYTDFVGVMRDVLTKYYTDNYIADTMNKVLSKADVLKKLTPADLRTMTMGKNLVKAQEATIPDITKSGWIKKRTEELVDKGADEADAKKQATAEWVPHERSVRAKFLARQFVKLKKAGVPKENRAKLAQEAWRNSVEQPPVTMQLLDNKTVHTYKGERYKFFSPKGSNEIYLIPEKLDRIMEEFGQPLTENAVLQVFQNTTQLFKTAALTITLPARLVIDAVSNATKLALMDTEALKYVPRAMRLMLRTSSAQDVRFLQTLAEAGLKNETKNLDDKTLAFAKEHEIIEPREGIKGVYAFTPTWKKILRYVLDPRVWATGSRNLTQRTDEFFKLVKASADFDRIQNGGYANAAGIIDVADLDKYGQASKVAQEFFVNPMRQSRFMRKYFTQLLMPFLNWASVDTLHAFRYVMNNPRRAGLQAAIILGGIQAWNNTGERRKLEELLPPDRRQIPHFITGYKNADGKPIILYLPIFPGTAGLTSLGLAQVPQNIIDATVPSTIPGQKKKEIRDIFRPTDVVSAIGKTTTSMLNPLPRTFFEQAANKSFYTGFPIVSRSEQGTSEGIAKRLEYTLNQIAPPYRVFTSAQRTTESLLSEDKAKPEAIYSSLATIFSPVKRIIKAEDMKKLADDALTRLEKQRTVTKNNAYQTILDLMPASMATNNYDAIAKVVQDVGLTERQLKSYIQAHQVEILRNAIATTKDPAKRKEYQELLKNLGEDRAIKKVKSLSADQFEQAEYLMNLRNEGVNK